MSNDLTWTPTVSVVICAYTEERWDDLLAALRSVTEQSRPAHEVIAVIDHNPELAARLRRALPGVIVAENTGPRGLSGARNTGIELARGDVVAFLDDDAFAAPDWLERLCAPYADPSVVGVGGAIEALWPSVRPPAMPAEFDWVVGCTYVGMPTQTSIVRNLIGANMSLRRSVFERIGGFRTDVGRVGTRPVGCEETELCIRARQQIPGATIVYEPSAHVWHRVAPVRTRWSYFRSRCYAEGLSKAIVARHAGSQDALESERAYTLKILPRGVVRGLIDTLSGRDRHGVLRSAAIIAGLLITTAGYLTGTLRARRG